MFPCSFFFRAYFNPLPPHGGRPADRPKRSAVKVFQSTPSAWRETTVTVSSPSAQNPFQSTPSAWRETQAGRAAAAREGISIHSLRMEGDCMFPCSFFFRAYFNPLPPHGGRPERSRLYPCREYISIHSLRMEGDSRNISMEQLAEDFNPLPPHGGRQTPMISNLSFSHFNPLPPHGGRQKSGATRLQYEKFQSTPSAWRETADPAEEIPA